MLHLLQFVIILLLLAVVAVLAIHLRKLHQHNRQITEALNALEKHDEAVNQKESRLDEPDVEQIDQEEQDMFLRLDKQLDDERLFCNPNLNRDMLCQLIGVDKNRLGRIITKYSGASNSTTYINRKRIQYAIALMQEHPDWTKMNIAMECGMTNTSTFNRIFLQTYGMTPTEYLKQPISPAETGVS